MLFWLKLRILYWGKWAFPDFSFLFVLVSLKGDAKQNEFRSGCMQPFPNGRLLLLYVTNCRWLNFSLNPFSFEKVELWMNKLHQMFFVSLDYDRKSTNIYRGTIHTIYRGLIDSQLYTENMNLGFLIFKLSFSFSFFWVQWMKSDLIL